MYLKAKFENCEKITKEKVALKWNNDDPPSCSTEGQKWLKQRLNNISSSNDNFVKRLLTSKIAQNCKM